MSGYCRDGWSSVLVGALAEDGLKTENSLLPGCDAHSVGRSDSFESS
jgi:hypothetical protein